MPFRHLPGVTSCRFKRGDYLFHIGDSIDYVYYLIRGRVKRETMTAGGHQIISAVKESGKITGSIVGLFSIYDEQFDGTATDDFVAMENCICYKVPVEVCKKYMLDHPNLLVQALGICISASDNFERLTNERSDLTAPARFCRFILEHGGQEGLVPKTYTNVEIGKFLSMHPVTVSRLIGALQKDHILLRRPQGLEVVDLARLEACAKGNYRLDYYIQYGKP